MRNANYSYGFRTAIGVYLFYLAYKILGGYFSGESTGIQFLIFGIVFIGIAVVCVFSGARYFITGKMDKKDADGKEFIPEEDEEQKDI